MIITKGKSFPTIQEAMQTMFNRNTGNGPKRGYYVFKSHTVWFPKAAIPDGNGFGYRLSTNRMENIQPGNRRRQSV
jgi:hypothetical protein